MLKISKKRRHSAKVCLISFDLKRYKVTIFNFECMLTPSVSRGTKLIWNSLLRHLLTGCPLYLFPTDKVLTNLNYGLSIVQIAVISVHENTKSDITVIFSNIEVHVIATQI